jgi:hypothetical protein
VPRVPENYDRVTKGLVSLDSRKPMSEYEKEQGEEMEEPGPGSNGYESFVKPISQPTPQKDSMTTTNTPSPYNADDREHKKRYNEGRRIYRAARYCKGTTPDPDKEDCFKEDFFNAGDFFWNTKNMLGFRFFSNLKNPFPLWSIDDHNLEEVPAPAEFIAACEKSKQATLGS